MILQVFSYDISVQYFLEETIIIKEHPLISSYFNIN